MSTRTYPRLTIEDFGHHLLRSKDIDPVYDTLNAMGWEESQRDRWLLAYWLCYHPGAACWLSEMDDGEVEGQYFSALMMAARNVYETPLGGRWPRAPERRHWRGENAVKSVEYLLRRYNTASEVVNYMAGGHDGWGEREPYADVARRVQEHYGFGSWISYKVADMLERCCGVPVCFTRDDAMYEAPTKAAIRLWVQKAGLPEGAKPKDPKRAVSDVVDYLLETFKGHPAPGGGRMFGLCEAETVLCKWASHMNGHYPLNNDLIEIHAGLEPWCAVSDTAKQFLSAFPRVGQY